MRHTSWAKACTLVSLLMTGQNAWAQDSGHMRLIPGETAVQWQSAPPELPRGTQIAVLVGDPGQPGPFVLRVKFPSNTVVAPHRHATAENLTVLSGDLYHGMGEKLDKERGERLAPGGFVYLPAMMPHELCRNLGDAVIRRRSALACC